MSSLIDSVLLWNPELDAGSRRLKTSGVIGPDHTNPKSWIGDVSVGRVSLQVCWEEGRTKATALILSIYPEDPVLDFDALFQKPHRDLLRPEGRYIGVSNELDPSLNNDFPETPSQIFHNLDELPIPMETTEVSADSDDVMSGIDRPDPGEVAKKRDSDEGEVDYEDGDKEEEGIGLEDLLPDSADEPLDGFQAKPEEWLEINGQHYHKGSLIAQYLKANRSKKVVERTLHVRGLTLEDLRKHHLTPSIGEDDIKVGNLVATIVWTGAIVCLVVCQVTAFRKDRSTQSAISVETLGCQRAIFMAIKFR